jgi:hypothetical protein
MRRINSRRRCEMEEKVLMLVTGVDGYHPQYSDELEALLESGQVRILAADYFDLFLCTAAGAEALREAVIIGEVSVGNDVSDGRYIAASGEAKYVLGGQIVTEEEFIKRKFGKRGLRLLRNGDDETLEDLLSPWTW